MQSAIIAALQVSSFSTPAEWARVEPKRAKPVLVTEIDFVLDTSGALKDPARLSCPFFSFKL